MKKEDIEDVYRLTPVQQGMLFHAVHSARPAEPAMYFQQFHRRLEGGFDGAAFARAWQLLVDANPILRTLFLWQDLEEPVQAIARRAEVECEHLDWRGVPGDEQAARLAAFLAADRRRGFDLSRAPLLRLAVLRLDEAVHHIIWSYHHLILDGWSVGLLLQEVGELQPVLAGGGEPRPRPRRPFREYVGWLRRQELAAAEAFWRAYLAGFTAPTPLGVDQPALPAGAALADQDEGYATQVRRVAEPATAALKSFAQRHRLTLNTVVEGAWALLLSRYAGEDDVVFGVTVSGRPPALPGVESMLGCFVNTLPVRVRLPPASTVVPWLQDLQREQAALRRHEQSPLVQVLGWSVVPRQLPLFESLFVFENFSADLSLTFAGVFQRTNYPLTLVVGPGPELALRADYETARFAPSTIARLLEHLETLLAAFVREAPERLADLVLLTAAEQTELRTHRTPPPDLTAGRRLHDLLATSTTRAPDAIAVFHEPHHLTYGELARRADRLADRLRHLGVGPDLTVGLCLEPAPELIVAIAAILQAGGAYLPLPPTYPDARLAAMIEGAGTDILITTQAHRARIPEPRRALVLDALEDLPPGWGDPGNAGPVVRTGPSGGASLARRAKVSVGVPPRDLSEPTSPSPPGGGAGPLPDNLAYLIYTSGSTGRPKGSLITHANAVRLLAATDPWFHFGPTDVWTLFHSYAFDFSVWEIWGALAHGGRLVIVPFWVSRSPRDLYELLLQQGVTVLNQTPSAFRQLVAAEGERGRDPSLALRYVIFGGEALDLPSLAPWLARRPGPAGERAPRLVNLYGITETTVHVTYRPIGRADLAAAAAGEGSPIGVAIPDLAVHLLDPFGNPTPTGVVGEMHVAGAGLARGYMGRPDLTAERFLPDPFGPAGGRLYRTGDLARRGEDGELHYLGRGDRQVKVRGFRIELGEVEAALAAHPQIGEAVALLSETAGSDGERRLVAFYVSASNAEPSDLDPVNLRSFLLQRLPDYMLPAAFVRLAAVPLTANGKADRRALAELAGDEKTTEGQAAMRTKAAGYLAPRTPTEELLAAIWADVLGIGQVGVGDDFFALGGHSLLATRVLARIRETFGVELELRVLFETPTVADLAPRLEVAWASASRQAPPLGRAARAAGEDLPLSFAQERLWFLDQLQPGSPAYNIPAALRLSNGPGHRLDPGALAGALAAVVRRHEALRTVYGARHGRPFQVVLPAVSSTLTLPLVDLAALPETLRERELAALARAEAARPFDLAAGLPLRATLLRENPSRHALLATQHHIASDGWSQGLFLAEVAAFYSALCAILAAEPAAPAPLPEPLLQYADFAIWQRRWLQGEELERELAYWREALTGVPVLQLPADRPRPQIPTFAGAARSFALAEPLAAGLSGLARRRGATPFMSLLAAFEALLHRLSGQADFAVGSPVANRGRPGTEGVIGFFVNTLVLRAGLAGDPGFGELLARARSAVLGAWAHQDVPFERIVQQLSPEREPGLAGAAPLFQVMLSFAVPEPAAIDLPGLSLTPLPVGLTTSKFDLTLSVGPLAGAGIAGQWVHSTALFDGATVARWAGYFETLLAGAVADPACPLSRLPLLPAAERAQLLVQWNRPEPEYPVAGFLHRLFAEQAALRPDAVALTCESAAVSYGELARRAAAWADRLRGLGVGPEVVVGVCAERSPELVAGLLGVLAAGGAYLPLDPALPDERLTFMLVDAAVPLLLADGPRAGRLAAPRIVPLRGAHASEAHTDLLDGPAELLPDHPAYVLYTSGSTGRPKGVVVTHRALGNRLQYARAADLDAGTVFLQKTTISFDVSVLEIFGPLVAGGRTVLARSDGAQDPDYLLRTLAEQEVTDASFPPSLLTVLMAEESFARCTALRTVITGGETVPVAVPRRFHELSAAELRNRYGPTEATISVTSWRCERGASPRVLPIGRPTAGAGAFLLDPLATAGEPVPLGRVGELYLGGLCLARGYLRRPDLTAERFVPHPFGAAGERLYRTGDLARHRADGALEFAGRVDQQVKVRGFRIELGEVEAALSLHPALREAAVADREDGAGRSLAAYLVAAPGTAPPGEGELCDFLAATLPSYMIPADFVFLAALPLAATGKVDRRALPAPGRRRMSGGEKPQGPVEEVIAGIWGDLLRRDEVGRDDDFFALGGHSLLATQAVSRLRQALTIELPLRALFEAPTPRELAVRAAEIANASAAGSPRPRRETIPRREPGSDAVPLSFAQERLWFLAQLQPAGAAYNIPIALRLRGPLDAAALAASLAAILRRHEALRTTFPARDGRPVQAIAVAGAGREPILPCVDLCQLPANRRQAAAREHLAAAAVAPFDLARGPLLRALLVRLDDGDYALSLAMHHIASDGWSMGVLVREVAALYPTFSARPAGPAPLAELPIQYADFAFWQRRRLVGAVLEAETAYWRSVLTGVATLALPTDRPRPAVQSFAGASRSFRLPPGVAGGVRALARARGATPFMVLLAAVQAVLGRWSGEEEVAVGTPIAGRHRQETEELIGFFVNTLVLRGDLAGDPGFGALVERLREVTLGAYAHQDLPFEKLVAELGVERHLDRTPLFQVLFTLLTADPGLPALPGLTLEAMPAETGTAKFDLTLSLAEAPDGAGDRHSLAGRAEYNRDLFDGATVARLTGHLGTLLAAALADPAAPLSSHSLLTAVERHHLVAELAPAVGPAGELAPAAGSAVNSERTEPGLQHRLAAAAARVPEAVAVSCEDRSLTYGELARRAGRVAARLRRLGVGPDVPVAVSAERSLEMIVALAGVLWAGGAYLPLDPSYPRERLLFLLTDALAGLAAPVLLTVGEEADAFVRDGLAGLGELAGRLRVVRLDEVAGTLRDELVAPAAVAPAGLAYVIYTSGSTGRPKGVQVTHSNAGRLFDATGSWFGFGPADVWTLFHSYAFDFSVWEIWGALLHGGRLVVVPYWVSRSPAAFRELLAREQVTVLNQTPSAFRPLVQADEEAGPAPALQALREVVFGGEALDLAALAPWLQRHGTSPRLVNMYGITETTVHVTYRPLAASDLGAAHRSPIGVAIPDLDLHLLDPRGEPVPLGLAGEIHVGGAGLARGYLGRPELTAERFVPDPFASTPGERLYRSGDLARRRSDGGLDFLGRADHQVKIRGFRIEPGEIAAALAGHPAVREAHVIAREDAPGERRLVAYVVMREAGEVPADSADSGVPAVSAGADSGVPAAYGGAPPGVPADWVGGLRAHLRARLPDYMVPAAYVELAALPLTANGKVDRRALPAPEGGTPGTGRHVSPRGPIEELLARIWAETLRLERVGVQDNFFELGGDSILVIQVISRLARAGYSLSARQLFERPIIAGLALLAQPIAGGLPTDEGPLVGDLPLSPIERWFLDRDPVDPHHFNQTLLLAAAEPLATEPLAQALTHLAHHHDALRLRLVAEAPGAWRQHCEAPTASDLPLAEIDLTILPAALHTPILESTAALLQTTLDLAAGPIARAALFRLPAPEPDRLLLILHHLAIDGVSWRILLEDLETLYRHLAPALARQGESPIDRQRGRDPLPPRTTSLRRWSERLQDLAQAPELRSHASFWLDRQGVTTAQLPEVFAGGDSYAGAARGVVVTLDEAETRRLLQEAPKAYRTQVNDLLLTALVEALGAASGERRLWLDLEGHGREEDALGGGIDLSRTVGWFTTLFPVPLDLAAGSPTAPGEALKIIKEQLRAVPERGLPYGLLRYLGRGLETAALAALPSPQVVFNYLGQLDGAVAPGRLFRPAAERTGPARSPRQRRPHALEITASVVAGRLQVVWTHGGGEGAHAAVAELAGRYGDELRRLVDHCTAPGAGGCTPSDFPLARLNAAELDLLLGRFATRDIPPRLVEDVYPATPTQAGMVFHSLRDPAGGEYLEQLALTLGADLDPAAFAGAWRHLVARHAVLRTAFAWRDLERPLQVLLREVELGWERRDWTDLPVEEGAQRWRELLAEDRRRGFDRERGPLVRFILAHLGDGTWRFLWSHHHALLDGWSLPILLKELFALYREAMGGAPAGLESPRAYRDFVAWLEGYPGEGAERYWRAALAGFTAPTPLGIAGPERKVAEGVVRPSRVLRLEGDTSEALRGFARRHGLTLNTLVQGAWALALSRYSGEEDVVFGAVTSGRSAPVAGIDGMVGLFINTLPARIQVYGWERRLPWLAELQSRQAEMRQHEHAALGAVHGWSEVPRGLPLFESILAFENYPVQESLREEVGSGLLAVEVVEQTSYPLTVIAVPGARLGLRVGYDPARLDGAAAERLLGHLRVLLEAMLRHVDGVLDELPLLSAAELQQLAVEWREEIPGLVMGRGLGLAPLGVVGELFWDEEPAAVAAMLLPDPGPGAAPGARLRRTGERVRRRADGTLEAAVEERRRGEGIARHGASPAGAPRGAVARRLAELWRELLDVVRLDVGDDFFDLGGHSLLAMKLASRLRQTFGVEVPLRRLFEASTLGEMAAEIEALRGAGPPLAAPAIRPRDRSAPAADLPLSFAEERLWFLDRMQPGTATYNVPAAVRLSGALDVPAFRRALGEIVRRHESLRTTFAVQGGHPVRRLAAPLPLIVPRVDLESLPVEAREREARRLAAAEARRPFDLAAGPLLRAVLLRLTEAGEPGEHLALLSLHHVIADGWSLRILLRELGALYGAFSADQPSPLPELPIQYADFALWQRERLQGAALADEIAHWRERLESLPPLLDLPADRPRPAVQRYRGASRRTRLAGRAAFDLHTLCRRSGLTPFMALLATLYAVLHRHTGRTDLAVGTPVAGRDRIETEGLIGCFLNSLVLRAELAAESTVADLLARTRDVALTAFAHQELPFERLVEELAPQRNLSHAPLFQVLLVLQESAGTSADTTPELPGLRLAPLEMETTTAKFDLTLDAQETGATVDLRWLYAADLFDGATIERLAHHFTAALAGLAADPALPLGALPLLTPGESHQLLEWNDTQADYAHALKATQAWGPELQEDGAGGVGRSLGGRLARPEGEGFRRRPPEGPTNPTLHDLIVRAASHHPERVAVTFSTSTLTYGALAVAAGRLANRLRAQGVGPDVLVGLCAERSLDLVVGLLSILGAGAAYVPLDPDYPPERLAFMIADSRMPLLLCDLRGATRIEALELPAGLSVLSLADLTAAATPEETSASHTSHEAGPDNLAYALFTSGSTGRPKGTMNTHCGIVNRLLWMQERYGLGEEDRVLQKTPFSFDVSVWEFFWPLLVGARLVMARPGGHQDPGYLARTIAAEEITTAHFVPSMLQVFLEAPGVESCTTLKRVIASGEALPPELERRFHRRLGADLHNLYGPTEAAVDVTAWACDRTAERIAVPIGRPIANTQIHLVDRELRPVALGVPGELLIGGVQVGRGYLARPDLTAERFVPDPFSAERGGRLYKTGDLARHRPDGAIEFLGRLDHQIKLRGLRIELGEIEAALGRHPAVREAVVLARSDGPPGEVGGETLRLVAYLVPHPGVPAPSPAALRAALAGSLPEHMLPTAWVTLATLPLTSSGKVDRKALPAPERATADGDHVAPRNASEQALAALWSAALGVERVGVHDNFFALGGNSIVAAVFVNRLQHLLGEAVDVVTLFAAPTVAELAARLAAEHPAAVAQTWGTEPPTVEGIAVAESPGAHPMLVPIERRGDRPPFFCLHPGGGGVLCYAELARELGNRQPFYGLRALGLRAGERIFESVEEVAAEALRALTATAVGPYFLGGWSFGGLVAFEVARLLETRGERVALLALIDAEAAPTEQGIDLPDDSAVLAHTFAGLPLSAAELRTLDSAERLPFVVELARASGHFFADFDVVQARRHLDVFQANARAGRLYRPGPYAGRVTLFRAAEGDRTPDLGWGRVAAGGVEIHEIPGRHETLVVPPSVGDLVRGLSQALRAAASRGVEQVRAVTVAGIVQ